MSDFNDYNEQYNQQSSRVAQQAVKPAAPEAQNAYPVQSAPAPAVRHRRSDRHKTADAAPAAYQPREEYQPRQAAVPQNQQWVRQQPPQEMEQQEYAAYQRPSRQSAPQDDGFMRRSVTLNDEYEDDENERDIPWLKIALGVLIAVLALCVVLYFLPNAGPLNGLKKGIENVVHLVIPEKHVPAEVLSFQTVTNNGITDSRIIFHLTTNQGVDGVRLEDGEGNEISCTVSLVNGAEETNKIWAITAIFAEPFEGDIYAAVKDQEGWLRTDKAVQIVISDPTPVPTQAPVITQTPVITQAPVATPIPVETQAVTNAPVPTWGPTNVPAVVMDSTNVPVPTWAPTNAPVPTQAPTQEPTEEPTMAPTEVPTPEPTEVPTPVPTQAPTPEPTNSPMPRLDASAGVGATEKVTDTVFIGGKTQSSFERETGLIAPNPDEYTSYEGGVFTFRGDNFRRNAAFGTAEIEEESMSVLWKTPVGSLRTADNGTLYGVGWTGQPAIVKWTKEVREMMNLYDAAKNTSALREVIFASQDGKIYFLNLVDGSATRDPINVGYPLKGSVSVDTLGRPLLAVGQGISKLPNKTGDIGLHVYNLMTGKREFLLNGRKSDSQKQYTTNGAFDGTALFLSQAENDAMIVAGENGLLYTVSLGSAFNFPNPENPNAEYQMETDHSIVYLRTKGNASKENQVGVESSVAMYDKYIFMADAYGIVRCVDSDTMKTVWAVDADDNTDATIALDWSQDDESLSLYTGNTAYARVGSKTDVTIRRLDGLTGEEIWNYNIKCDYDKDQRSGCKASPVVGQHGIANLVIFTVNQVAEGGSRVIALNKDNGSVAWTYDLENETVSSPVAVYNEAGEAWIIQADGNGLLTMLDGENGKRCSTLDLGGKIEGSPAVYRDILVIGTCSKDNSYMYAIELK